MKLKGELVSQEQYGNNYGNYVHHDKGHAGQHLKLGIEEITLWAHTWVSSQHLHYLFSPIPNYT